MRSGAPINWTFSLMSGIGTRHCLACQLHMPRKRMSSTADVGQCSQKTRHSLPRCTRLQFHVVIATLSALRSIGAIQLCKQNAVLPHGVCRLRFQASVKIHVCLDIDFFLDNNWESVSKNLKKLRKQIRFANSMHCGKGSTAQKISTTKT